MDATAAELQSQQRSAGCHLQAIDRSIAVRLTPTLLAFLREAAAKHLKPDWLAEIRALPSQLDTSPMGNGDGDADGSGAGYVSVSFAMVKSIRDRLAADPGAPPPPPLWRLLAGSRLTLPRPAALVRSPELEARLARLRAAQEQREYDRMTADVRSAPLGRRRPASLGDDSLSGQLRSLNRQLATVANFLITVGAAFAFGYKACEYSGGDSLAQKVSLGLLLGTVVFFADLYFVVKLDYLSGRRREPVAEVTPSR